MGSGQSYTIATVVAKLAALMRPTGVQVDSDRRLFRRHDIDLFCCDNRRLHELTGWRPEISIDRGLGMTIEWFASNGQGWPWKHSASERAVQAQRFAHASEVASA